MTPSAILRSKGACEEAVTWLGKRSAAKAWAECPRGDWMLWIAARVGVDHKLVVRAACDCARLALKYVPKGEDRPRIAIETTERWCEGKATVKEVREARAAAHVASPAAYYAYYAAYYAAASYAAASYAAAPHKMQARYAKAVRKRIPWRVMSKALKQTEKGSGGGSTAGDKTEVPK